MSEITPDAKATSFVSPAVDLVIGAGAWSLPLLLLTGFAAQSFSAGLAFGFYAVALLVNYPHFMATLARAYRKSPTHKWVTVWLTAFLALVLVYLHVATEWLPLAFAIYLTWSPWHYTSQNRGIATLFLQRSGIILLGRDRLLYRLAFTSTFLMWALGMHSGPSLPMLARLDLDPTWTLPLRILLLGFFFVAMGTVFVSVNRRAGGTAVGKRGLMLAAVVVSTQLFWFVFPWLLDRSGLLQLTPLYFAAGALAFMHCAQYLWVIFFSEKREHARDQTPWSARRYFAILVGGGATLFILGPWVMSRAFSYDLVTSFLLFQAVVSVHHFAVDGVIWKLREPAVAKIFDPVSPSDDVKAGDAPEAGGASSDVSSGERFWTPAKIALGVLFSVGALVGVVDVVQYALTRPGASAENLALATKINGNDPRVFLRRAEVAMRAANPKAALVELDAGLALAPHNLSLLQARGTALASSGDFALAYDHLRALPPHLRDNVETLTHLSALARELDKTDDAKKWIEAAEKIAPDNPEVLRHLGVLALEQDKKAAAIDYLSKSLVATAKRVHHIEGDDILPLDALIGVVPDRTTLDVAADLAHLLVQQKRWDDAEALLRVLTDASVRAQSPFHAMRAVGDSGRVHTGRNNVGTGILSIQRALRISAEVDAPLEVAELWTTLAAMLEMKDAPMALRYASLLRANTYGAQVEVNAGLRAFRLRKSLLGNLRRMSEAMDPVVVNRVTSDLDGHLEEALSFR